MSEHKFPETVRIHFDNQAQAICVMGKAKARPVVIMEKATWETKYLPRLQKFYNQPEVITQRPL